MKDKPKISQNQLFSPQLLKQEKAKNSSDYHDDQNLQEGVGGSEEGQLDQIGCDEKIQ